MKKILIITTLLLLANCAGYKSAQIEALKSKSNIYALSNIRYDARGNRVHTINYQLNGDFIPICSKISIEDYGKNKIKFRTTSNNKEYIYIKHKVTKESLDDHIAKVFGSKCPQTQQLSAIDREGIKNAKIYKGMTKKGVLYAVGNPPSHVNNINDRKWTYWTNRFNRVEISFNSSGIVQAIKD